MPQSAPQIQRSRFLGALLGLSLVAAATWVAPWEGGALLAQENETLDSIIAGVLPTRSLTLPNGMEVVLYQDSDAAAFTAAFIHRAGVAREWQGLKGAAHVAGALMTAGTSTIGTRNYGQERRILQDMDRLDREMGEARHTLRTTSGNPDVETAAFDALNEARTALQENRVALERLQEPNAWAKSYEALGGQAPVVKVGHDGILYTATLPASALGAFLRQENRRLQDPVSHTFYQVRDRLAQSWEGEWNSGASYPLWEALSHATYLIHPYGHYRGTAEQLQGLSRGELDYFVDLFTDPSRTVLAIVGPQPLDEMESLVKRSLTAPGRPPAGPLEGEELPQRGERRILVRLEGPAQLMVAYHQKKPWDPRERAALVVLADLLAHPTDGLLPVVLEASGQGRAPGQAAAALYPAAGPIGPEDPASLVLGLRLKDAEDLCRTEAALWAALATLAEEGPPEQGFKAAQARVAQGITRLEEDPATLAPALAWTLLTHGSADALALHQRAVLELTPSDLQGAALDLFNPNNRTVAVGWPSRLPGSLAACDPLGGEAP